MQIKGVQLMKLNTFETTILSHPVQMKPIEEFDLKFTWLNIIQYMCFSTPSNFFIDTASEQILRKQVKGKLVQPLLLLSSTSFQCGFPLSTAVKQFRYNTWSSCNLAWLGLRSSFGFLGWFHCTTPGKRLMNIHRFDGTCVKCICKYRT